MATNKNQHFVPRCYLKEFTYNSDNKAINIYNIDRNSCIPLAPVKNQCSKSYFYGENEKLEKAIQYIEGSYASMLYEIIHRPRNLIEDHKLVLRRFWLLQYLRTESACMRAVEMTNNMSETVGLKGEEFNLQIKDAVQMAMKTFADEMHIIDDLKICLILNKTKLPFITCDDPAVLTNKWHLNDERTMHRAFGLRTSGNIVLLPLTPKIMCIAYDGDVYSIPHQCGWTSTSHINDIKAFNQHQFLNCRANIYIKNIDHANFVSDSFKEISTNRPSKRHRLHFAVLDHEEGGYSRYKVVDPEISKLHSESIIHTESIAPLPTIWPRLIKRRNNGSVYTNGTGLGYLRKAHILAEYGDFDKQPVTIKGKNPH